MMVTTKTTPATSSRGRRRPGSNSREAWPTPQLTPWKSSEGSSCRSRRRRRKGSAKRLLGESARGLLPTWTTAAALPTSTSGNALQRLPRPGACSSRASTRRSSCPRPSSRSRKRRRRRRCRRTRALLLLLLLPLPRRLRRRQFAPSPAPAGRRFARRDLRAYVSGLFHSIPEARRKDRLPPVSLTRFDLFHVHFFLAGLEPLLLLEGKENRRREKRKEKKLSSASVSLGLLFHAAEYPALCPARGTPVPSSSHMISASANGPAISAGASRRRSGGRSSRRGEVSRR